MAKLKQTWQYNEGGCPTCNATGTTKRNCPTWSDYKRHDRSGCKCNGGQFYDPCPTCRGTGHLGRPKSWDSRGQVAAPRPPAPARPCSAAR